MIELVFATHNLNKFIEVKSLMPKHIDLLSLDDIDCYEDIPETAKTIEGNAVLKARYVKKHYGLDCFADDTGLEVTTLDGAPGVFSARYAGPQRDSTDNINKLLTELSDKQDRSARFKTAIALTLNGKEEILLGICEGTIIETARGEKGFGYDPVFQPNGFSKTFAEMSLVEKSDVGHRGKAIRKLIEFMAG